ncbi:hypothetical protein ABEB36_013754 [Hypothenemus hampei]|uniref:DUF4817 domain-containing protein n=1 Tax=Hypothenemus hampei TaxID=57062 RepID=A0ABD1E560_HYPHA
MSYSLQELTNMMTVIGECNGNCLLASRVYAQMYPDRQHPDRRCMEKLKERFERTGSVAYEKRRRAKTVLNDENEFAICLTATEDPETSVRKISRHLDIKKSSVAKCLQKNDLYLCLLLISSSVNY